MKYLYGASVQGIQNFIFQTNKLKEIIGASNLVEKICTTMFEPYYKNVQGAKLIIGAAGNIKCIFEDRHDCERAVREFRKKVLTNVPGITLSHAVVEYDDSAQFQDVIEELESKLRIQRNKNVTSTLLGTIGIRRSRQTGLPAIKNNSLDGFVDDSTYHKLLSKDKKELASKFYGDDFKTSKIPYDIEDITGKNDWIAIIHADGNGLGQVVMKIGAKEREFSEFSEKLNQATIAAASGAFQEISQNFSEKYPIRPVVLGGDDLTVICRADLALPFCKQFLSLFEQKTKEKLGNILKQNTVFNNSDYLTACAGIAFIKSSFPFYYGYQLAEELCSEAKKTAKQGLSTSSSAPSCLMLHKVQDSFIRDYGKDIVQRELTPQNNISWKFGPYFLTEGNMEQYWTIEKLTANTEALYELQDTGLKSSIRESEGVR